MTNRTTSTRRVGIVERSARGAVGSVGFVRRNRTVLSLGSLLLILVLGIAYLTFGALQQDPFAERIQVHVDLVESGGLLAGQDVTYRGIPVGKVEAVEFTETGVVATASIDSETKIPENSEVRVSGLSAAGEQYLDFRPTSTDGPYLVDGTVIASDRTSVPIGLAKLLLDLKGTGDQIDVPKLQGIIDELRVGPEAPQKLASILDGGVFLISTLDSVLPQTVSMLNSTKVVLGTLSETSVGLTQTAGNLNSLFSAADRMDGGFRRLVDNGSTTMESIDAVIADNSPTMVQLLGNLATVSQVTYLRVPALQELFTPSDRGSTLAAITSIFRDGGLWAIAEPYPRYVCDYDLPRNSAALPLYPEPYLYTYCNNPDPGVLIRGSRNAPRPPGDDTAGPPPGVDPLQTSDPTPIGPNTIPTPTG
ncbi:MlaD family protein [Antrihabitans sp. YC2-6]|uniref:MlaD family protein n=1 Tax=Antrihabitans sp. YC2-6 TaxID=2799498 RepID=UPI0018F3ECD1|nr:MlaD family protein [Antrihabitans sp. YC2-6]MBJ8348906.1 MCE family protein [Antrihabitans sp. YC2-6]